jgi:hypothetical protein
VTADRIVQLASIADERVLVTVLTQQRVLLLAGTRLAALAPAHISASFREYVAFALARARARAIGFSLLTTRVVEALEAEQIPAVPVKGATLAAELYDEPAVREYADIDVLVPAADLDRAARVTRALGWTAIGASARRNQDLHQILRHPDASLPAVELHWRIHWYETSYATGLLERSRWVDGMRRLPIDDQFATLLLFYARDGFAGLRYAADIAAWWDRNGSSAAPAALANVMTEHPALAEPWRAAVAAAVPVAGLPGNGAWAALRPRRRASVLAARLTNWDLTGTSDQIEANVTLIDGLLTPRGGFRAFLARQLRRPAGSPPADPAAGTRRAQALHLGKLLVRYLIALGRLRRDRCWSPRLGG